MRSIHLKDLHVPKGPTLFAFSVAEAAICCVAFLVFLVCWSFGGTGVVDLIGGSVGLAMLFAGIVIGIVAGALTRPEP
jgi:hypothetical protein